MLQPVCARSADKTELHGSCTTLRNLSECAAAYTRADLHADATAGLPSRPGVHASMHDASAALGDSFQPCFSKGGKCHGGPVVLCPELLLGDRPSSDDGKAAAERGATAHEDGSRRRQMQRPAPKLAASASRRRRCDVTALSFMGVSPRASQSVSVADAGHWSDRYSTVVRCAGRSFIFSRRGDDASDHSWSTVVRATPHQTEHPTSFAATSSAPYPQPSQQPWAFGSAVTAFAPTLRLSHNAAFACVNGTLIAYGGRARPKRQEMGIRRTTSRAADWPLLRWTTPTLVISGTHPGCREERSLWRTQGCEFDGRLWVVRHRMRFLLYARANMHEDGGARHVQVASSPNGVDGWSPFQLVRIANYSVCRENNIYYFSVHKHLDKLVAVFPAVLGDAAGGVYVAFSEDGVHWSSPTMVMRSRTWAQRTDDHPLGWELVRPAGSVAPHPEERVVLHIEHKVSTISRQRPHRCLYAFDAKPCRRAIHRALSEAKRLAGAPLTVP